MSSSPEATAGVSARNLSRGFWSPLNGCFRGINREFPDQSLFAGPRAGILEMRDHTHSRISQRHRFPPASISQGETETC